MDALSIAFDIIIVGVLALPWVLLVVYLFFWGSENFIGKLLDLTKTWVIEKDQTAVASVLLFAMAYPLGSAVSRIAQDFFDDGDLDLPVTETSIRVNVYCQVVARIENQEIAALKKKESAAGVDKQQSAAISSQISTLESSDKGCGRETADLHESSGNLIFHIHEGAVFLKGTDANERLRQYQAQKMVLRGAAFNGLLAFSLCLFWWYLRFPWWLRWIVPSLYLLCAYSAWSHHRLRDLGDPPYMEFTLLMLGLAGWHVLRPRSSKGKGAQAWLDARKKGETFRAHYLVLALFLTATAFLGWWATEVLYDQQIIYSYKAITQTPDPATPSQK